jgi:hypothetical protein
LSSAFSAPAPSRRSLSGADPRRGRSSMYSAPHMMTYLPAWPWPPWCSASRCWATGSATT